jgi:hypothetical protein
MQMNVLAFAREMLKTDPSIRYVAVVTDDYHILASEQREGVPTLTSEEMQRNFVSIVPQIIIESVNKLAGFLGKVEGITAHYEKALLVFYKYGNLIVMVSFQPEVATPFFNRITEAFEKHSAQYLT